MLDQLYTPSSVVRRTASSLSRAATALDSAVPFLRAQAGAAISRGIIPELAGWRRRVQLRAV